jgi:hypothetical protein
VRFILLVVAAVAVGALSAVGIQTLLPQQSWSVIAAMRTLGDDAAQFRLPNLNPIRAVYDDVRQKITSGEASRSLNLPSGPSIKLGGPIQLPKPVVIDQDAIKRSIAAGVNARIQQDYQRTQSMIQYGRNPMGWHGPPPH